MSCWGSLGRTLTQPACSSVRGSPQVPGLPTSLGQGDNVPDLSPPTAVLGGAGPSYPQVLLEACRPGSRGWRRITADWEAGLAHQHSVCVRALTPCALSSGAWKHLVYTKSKKLLPVSTGTVFWSQLGLDMVGSQQKRWCGQARLSLSPRWAGTRDMLGGRTKVCVPEGLSPKKRPGGARAHMCVGPWLSVCCLLSSAACPACWKVFLTTL